MQTSHSVSRASAVASPQKHFEALRYLCLSAPALGNRVQIRSPSRQSRG